MSTTTGPARTDTIAAVATAPGRGAIGLLRLSGPQAAAIAQRLVGSLPPPRRAGLRNFRDHGDGGLIDSGLVLHFPAPDSFTGEDVVELQGHGGVVVLDLLLRAACSAGARPARPGEFSERAFLNGRLDLAQAEAIADLIDAGSAAAVRAANRSLQGEFSRRVSALVETLIALRRDLEAALDFADEDVPWLSGPQLQTRLAELVALLQALQQQAAQGRRLREGLTIAIAGQPNVGKSTLLNRLAGSEAAIVSPEAGTTRDVLREHLVLRGLPLTVLDTAGLRDTDHAIEREGVRRAWAAVAQAELVLFVADDRAGLTDIDRALLAQFPPGLPLILVFNKCDLSGRAPQVLDAGEHAAPALRISAASDLGIESLVDALCRSAGFADPDAQTFTARARHLDALRSASAHLESAAQLAPSAPELIAEELRLAQQALDEITGRFSSDDLLGRIFSSFCLGK
ncbi:MAG: tRNA uridine-5-carboxymethylaminomethyl(34) synthesis GTPase MnmE [Nevskia sp.]